MENTAMRAPSVLRYGQFQQENNIMAFVNEFVPEEDAKKYGLEEIDRHYRHSSFHPEWTVDRERDIYLREVEIGREESANRHGFTLYWKGALLFVRLTRKGGGVRHGEQWSEWSLYSSPLQGSIIGISDDLEENRAEIIADLKAALTAYKDFGMYSTSTKHAATFTF